KRDTPAHVQQAKKKETEKPTESSFSCDDPQPFHFAVEPDAINDQRNGGDKRCDRACKINRRAFHHIDPDAPQSHSQREKGRENNENNMEAFKGHLAKDRIVVPP